MTGWFWLSLCGDKNISRLQKTQLLYVSHVHTHGDRGHLQMKISETNELFILHGHLDRLCIKAWLFICNWDLVPKQDLLTPAYQAKELGNVCRVPVAQLNIEGMFGFQSLKCQMWCSTLSSRLPLGTHYSGSFFWVWLGQASPRSQ